MKQRAGWMWLAACSVLGCGASDAGVSSASAPIDGTSSGGTNGEVAGGTAGGAATGEAGSGASASTGTAGASDGSGTSAGGLQVNTGGGSDSPAGECGSRKIATGRVVPDIMIVLDRSGSMQPREIGPGINCATTDDFLEQLACLAAGVDCNDPAWGGGPACGGVDVIGVDRWSPSVSAIKSLTTQLAGEVRFGLMTFPGANDSCQTGSVRVPVGADTSTAIAAELDRIAPAGGTPTGPTLQALARDLKDAPTDPDRPPPPQYVLLVTDGEPTCPNARGRSDRSKSDALNADRQLTVAAIDTLRDGGVKTYVVGYDAQLDSNLVAALNEFAQHGGTEHYRPVQDEASLVAELRSITSELVECSYTVGDEVPDDPRYVKVVLDGIQLVLDDPNGWSIEGTTVTIQGSACQQLQDGGTHLLNVSVECAPVVVQ